MNAEELNTVEEIKSSNQKINGCPRLLDFGLHNELLKIESCARILVKSRPLFY